MKSAQCNNETYATSFNDVNVAFFVCFAKHIVVGRFIVQHTSNTIMPWWFLLASGCGTTQAKA